MDLLVVEDDVWQPYPVARDPEAVDAAKVLGIPRQQLVAPLLIQPHVGRHHLILLILQRADRRIDRTARWESKPSNGPAAVKWFK